eukprot:8489544-Alexandrium_andersonii.AAC.1
MPLEHCLHLPTIAHHEGGHSPADDQHPTPLQDRAAPKPRGLRILGQLYSKDYPVWDPGVATP